MLVRNGSRDANRMDIKRWAIAGNLYASLPLRLWVNRQAARSGLAPLMVLFYHRVADSHPNPWTIGCELFERQMRWLQRHVEMVPLAEIQRRIQLGRNDCPAACVTFDDGYADNCDFALPFLVRERIPCTYFVATAFLTNGRTFPHDDQVGQPLRPNDCDQIARWADRGIEMGAHTRNHVDLGTLRDEQQLMSEIAGSRSDLVQLTGQPIHYFAFPFGQPNHLSVRAFQIAREAGFAGVCSAYGGYNVPGQPAFHLQRIHGDPEMTRFRNWMTVDPRKKAVQPPATLMQAAST